MTDVGRTMREEEAARELNRSVIRNQEAIEAANGDYLTPTQPVRGQTPLTNTTTSAIRQMNALAHEMRDAYAPSSDGEEAEVVSREELLEIMRETGLRAEQLDQPARDILAGRTPPQPTYPATPPEFDATRSSALEAQWRNLQTFLPDAMEAQFLREFLDQHGLQRARDGNWSVNTQDTTTIDAGSSYVPIIAVPSEPGRGR